MFLRSAYDYYGWEGSYYQLEDNPNITSCTGSASGLNESSCKDVLTCNWADRCDFVKINLNCQDVDGFINYVSLIYCSFGQELFPLTIIILVGWIILLFIGLAVSADDYFCPSIEVLTQMMRLSQNIAGVTLLALGNGAPDIFSALAGIGQDIPELVFGELFGAGVFVTACVAGSVAFTRPFHSMERPFLRDVSFYLMSGFWAFYIFWSQQIRLVDSIGFLVVYMIYILVVVLGRYINQKNRGSQRISTMLDNDELAEENENDSDDGDHLEPKIPSVTGNPPEIQLVPECRDCTSISANMNLLVSALNPIDREEWQDANIPTKVYTAIKAPVDLLFRLTIPVVDSDKPRDNWCQYLAIIQCVTGPVFSVFATSLANDRLGSSSVEVWHLTLILSLLLAITVGFTSRSTKPPVYLKAFAIAGFIFSIVWIYVIANELVSVLRAFGVMFGLSNAILGLTVLAWGNSIGDMIADTSMARRGSPRTGFSACFGGPLFNLLLGIGLPFTIELIQGGGPVISLVCTKMTLVLSAGLFISLSFSFIWLPLRKFYASKTYGVILVIFYVVFLVICIVMEFTMDKKQGHDKCF